jgi:hypothetical protein
LAGTLAASVDGRVGKKVGYSHRSLRAGLADARLCRFQIGATGQRTVDKRIQDRIVKLPPPFLRLRLA